jgi:signal transduction histidine kinase/ActR/RegA family two-component response regulator
MKNTAQNIDQLKEDRVLALEKMYDEALAALESAASLGDFQAQVSSLSDVATILQTAKERIRQLVPLKAMAFYLVNEENSEFYLAEWFPAQERNFFEMETDFLIDKGMFAWALREKGPVTVSTKDRTQRLILHVLTTSSRIRGMFVGVLQAKDIEIHHSNRCLLSIVLLNSANAIESFELYSLIRDNNRKLEQTVQRRTAQLTYRLEFDDLISKISTTFINHPLEETDSGILEALRQIAAFIRAERGFLVLMAQHSSCFDNCLEWPEAGAKKLSAIFKKARISDFPLLCEQLVNSKPLQLSSIQDFPDPILSHNHFLLDMGCQSLIVVPLISGKSLIGMLGFDTVQSNNEWPEDTASLLNMVGEIFVNALERKWADDEKKRLEAQLMRTQKLKAIGTLAGGIAHDFNNLLQAIQGNVSLIAGDMPPDHACHEGLQNICKQIKSGAKLTKQLLGYARKGQYCLKPLDLNGLIRETTLPFGQTRKDISIHLKLSHMLQTIEADEGQIEQVLMNLFLNAADAMPQGGHLTLETTNVTEKDMRGKLYQPDSGPYVLLSVTDSGIGMSREQQERIFDPFFTTKEMGKASGMGLASVYGIMKSHGGYIDVHSVRGQGSVFMLYFKASGSKAVRRQANNLPIHQGSGTILIIDDEQRVLEAGRHMLSALNYSVLSATGGREAVELYKTQGKEIDLIMLDIIMPEMGGEDTFRHLKSINPDVKVLLCSGSCLEGQAEKLLNQGCLGFLQKPFDLFKLSQEIIKILPQQTGSSSEYDHF